MEAIQQQEVLSTTWQPLDACGPYQLAVVGCGPRGLYCLERLSAELTARRPSVAVEITIYERATELGAGPVYNTSQPDYLRMNFAAKHIDAWPMTPQRRDDELNLLDYLADRGWTSLGPESYVPRRLVGAYLRDCMALVKERLERVAVVRVVQEHVSQLQDSDGGWSITSSGKQRRFDEVLVTVGHESWRPPAGPTIPFQPLISSVFPCDKNLNPLKLPSASRVAIRGFGLTFIDAVLALTEGRGGKFVESGDGTVRKYQPSGQEPNCILPFSRSGRPMLAKPVASKMELPARLDEIWLAGSRAIANLPEPISSSVITEQLWPIILNTAAEALGLARGRTVASPEYGPSDIEAWFQKWTLTEFQPVDAYHAMENSVRVAEGRALPDAGWALGESWRQLYPALVDAISYGRLSAEAWPQFRPVAIEMERIAFGPPAENLKRLIALLDDGVVSLQCLTAKLSERGLTANNGTQRCRVQPDVIVNAVLPGPTDFDLQGPLGTLLKRGTIRQLYGCYGVEVDESGTPISEAGEEVEGLSLLGRNTEGCILGNDTLSRQLHHHPRLWAAKVAAHMALRQSRQT